MMMGVRTAAWAKAGAPLPYDAEVEYLQGDGVARIMLDDRYATEKRYIGIGILRSRILEDSRGLGLDAERTMSEQNLVELKPTIMGQQ